MSAQTPFTIDTTMELISRPICFGKEGKNVVVTGINITNLSYHNYTIEVLLITPTHNSTGRLYAFDLLAGYMIMDDTLYRLSPKSEIWVKSDCGTVNVVVNGYEELISN